VELRIYSVDEMRALCERAGFIVEATLAQNGTEPVSDQSRLLLIARAHKADLSAVE
jgi:hypothetical protein